MLSRIIDQDYTKSCCNGWSIVKEYHENLDLVLVSFIEMQASHCEVHLYDDSFIHLPRLVKQFCSSIQGIEAIGRNFNIKDWE